MVQSVSIYTGIFGPPFGRPRFSLASKCPIWTVRMPHLDVWILGRGICEISENYILRFPAVRWIFETLENYMLGLPVVHWLFEISKSDIWGVPVVRWIFEISKSYILGFWKSGNWDFLIRWRLDAWNSSKITKNYTKWTRDLVPLGPMGPGPLSWDPWGEPREARGPHRGVPGTTDSLGPGTWIYIYIYI